MKRRDFLRLAGLGAIAFATAKLINVGIINRVATHDAILEDAGIIYRLQRGPERRIFYIDVGKTPKANTHVEQIKNEFRI